MSYQVVASEVGKGPKGKNEKAPPKHTRSRAAIVSLVRERKAASEPRRSDQIADFFRNIAGFQVD